MKLGGVGSLAFLFFPMETRGRKTSEFNDINVVFSASATNSFTFTSILLVWIQNYRYMYDT